MITAKASPQIDILKFPWQERPEGCNEFIWRYKNNPIIKEDHIPTAAGICNSSVAVFEGKFAGVFRVADKKQNLNIHVGFSNDGIKWQISPAPIDFICDDRELINETNYDPRITKIGERYYLTWCTVNHRGAPTTALGYTDNFKDYYLLESVFPPCNRNGVLFPRKINGMYAILSRPSDMGHTPFGDIYYSQSPDLHYWGDHRFVMGSRNAWESLKIGTGPTPIETSDGWLVIYHGVQQSCCGSVYSMGVALLDLDEPWKVIKRRDGFLMNPRCDYERVGIVPNVVFPCSVLHDESTGRLAIYYGAADTVVALAFTRLNDLKASLDF